MTILEAQRDPFLLDRLDVKGLAKRPRVIVTNELFAPMEGGVPVCYIAPPGPLSGWLGNFWVALRLLLKMRSRGAVGLVSLGKKSGSLFCFLNSFLPRGGPVLACRVLVPSGSGPLKNYFMGRILRSVTMAAVWSRPQIENYHRAFGCPRDRFVFIPYKANHSKRSQGSLPVADYLFSGGNSERDYKTLFEAVSGLPVPVIVSATNPAATRGLKVPENVILVKAVEPAFERLMAGSRVMALCLKADLLRGSGEATMLNAMWHGRPLVVADNVSAPDYIQDGVEGFVVPAGDAGRLRARILELWKDPALGNRMGKAGQDKVARLYTHDQYKARMQTFAMLMYSERS